MEKNDIPDFWKGFIIGIMAFLLVVVSLAAKGDYEYRRGKNDGYNDGRNDMIWQIYNESKEVTDDGKER